VRSVTLSRALSDTVPCAQCRWPVRLKTQPTAAERFFPSPTPTPTRGRGVGTRLRSLTLPHRSRPLAETTAILSGSSRVGQRRSTPPRPPSTVKKIFHEQTLAVQRQPDPAVPEDLQMITSTASEDENIATMGHARNPSAHAAPTCLPPSHVRHPRGQSHPCTAGNRDHRRAASSERLDGLSCARAGATPRVCAGPTAGARVRPIRRR